MYDISLHITHRFGQDEGVGHKVQQGGGGVNVVEGIGSFQGAMHRVIHDGGWQCVETQNVRHFALALPGKGSITYTSIIMFIFHNS